jgi:hypothetical protein
MRPRRNSQTRGARGWRFIRDGESRERPRPSRSYGVECWVSGAAYRPADYSGSGFLWGTYRLTDRSGVMVGETRRIIGKPLGGEPQEEREWLESEAKLRIDTILGGTVLAVLAIVMVVGALALIHTFGLL